MLMIVMPVTMNQMFTHNRNAGYNKPREIFDLSLVTYFLIHYADIRRRLKN